MSFKENHRYSKSEERLNILSHGFGFLLSLLAFPFLIVKAGTYASFWASASFVVYGLSMLILYAASTCYHAAKNPKLRRKLNIVDHAAIYVLIAGSYTPFCLAAITSSTGWYFFLFVWSFALVGVILKLFFTGKYDKLSTFLYLLMGWQALFLINPMRENVSTIVLQWIVVGGVFYSIGALLYSLKKLQCNHFIFHVFVLLGSAAHFIAIYKI